ncbi:MAG: glycosyltransferase family 2 protein [Patescibacteria group bacterium]
MKLSIIIPAFNEEEAIEKVVRDIFREIKKNEPSSEIVIVDNGSIDDTPQIISRLQKEFHNLKTVRVFPNKGYGNGLLRGVAVSSGEILGWIHGDNQISAEDLFRVWHELVEKKLDLCKAVRQTRSESIWRKTQSRLYNSFFRILFGGKLSDINGSPKVFKRALFDRLQILSLDWFIDPEIVIKALRSGARIGEVEVFCRPRLGGRSKTNWFASFEFFKNMIFYKFGVKLKRE